MIFPFRQAVAEMNEQEMENGKRIYVGRAQRKIERQGELRDKFEKLKEERLKRYQVHFLVPTAPKSLFVVITSFVEHICHLKHPSCNASIF